VVATPDISIAPVDDFVVFRKLPNDTKAPHRSIGQQLPLGYIAKLICTDGAFAFDADACPSVPSATEPIAPPSASYSAASYACDIVIEAKRRSAADGPNGFMHMSLSV
jgi:hypothetical protein